MGGGLPCTITEYYEDVRDENDMCRLVEDILCTRSNIQRIERQAATMIGVLKKRLSQIERSAETNGAQWVSDNLPKGKKSMDLLTGRVGFRRTPYKIEIKDKESTITWSLTNLANAIEKVETTKVKKKVLMDHFKATGELPPGVSLSPSETKFYVTD